MQYGCMAVVLGGCFSSCKALHWEDKQRDEVRSEVVGVVPEEGLEVGNAETGAQGRGLRVNGRLSSRAGAVARGRHCRVCAWRW